MVQSRSTFAVSLICALSASGTSIRKTLESVTLRSTISCWTSALSARLSVRSFCVMRVRRSASLPMSETNSRIVSASISFCRMESDRSLMEASGVFSSCEASETNWRCCASDSCNRSVSLLNSVASVANSSEPRI